MCLSNETESSVCSHVVAAGEGPRAHVAGDFCYGW